MFFGRVLLKQVFYVWLNVVACGWLSGISGKSQILFSVVYTARYLDLLTTYISTYNTVMKLVFVGASYATVYLMYVKFKATYDHNHDTFRIEFLLIPTFLLALLLNHEFTVMEVSELLLNDSWNGQYNPRNEIFMLAYFLKFYKLHTIWNCSE